MNNQIRITHSKINLFISLLVSIDIISFFLLDAFYTCIVSLILELHLSSF